MLQQSFIISFMVMAIWATMWEGAIFDFIRKFGDKYLHEKLQKPIYDCPICAVPYYGSLIYWLLFHVSWQDWAVTIIVSMGINTVFVKLMPDP